MTYVDSVVLNFTELVLCRRFQTWTGRTNVWLAFQLTNLSIIMYFTWVAAFYLLSADVTLRVFVVLFCGSVFFVLTRTIFKSPIEASQAEAYRRVAKGLLKSSPPSGRSTQDCVPHAVDRALAIRCGSSTPRCVCGSACSPRRSSC